MKEKAADQLASQPEASLVLTEIVERQGVQPITDFDSLLGSPSPGDESPEEFAIMLREWRREGSR